jgi:citronellol/citronellal dehydrogenase
MTPGGGSRTRVLFPRAVVRVDVDLSVPKAMGGSRSTNCSPAKRARLAHAADLHRSRVVYLDAVDLIGKCALVTGASRGVGRATAIALAAAGARVACAARATDASPVALPGTIDETVRAIESSGGEAVAVPANLALDAEVEAMVATTIERLGRIDVLVNNAAITFPGDLEQPMKRYDLVMAVDLRAPLLAIRAAAPGMCERGEGAIVNVSSFAALNYFPGLMAYGMAKAALEHLTISAATQLKDHGVAVNTFRIDLPVASEGFLAAMPDADHSDWEPPEVAAEGIVWMLRRPPDYTARNESMARLRAEHGIMASRAARAHSRPTGLITDSPLGS